MQGGGAEDLEGGHKGMMCRCKLGEFSPPPIKGSCRFRPEAFSTYGHDTLTPKKTNAAEKRGTNTSGSVLSNLLRIWMLCFYSAGREHIKIVKD